MATVTITVANDVVAVLNARAVSLGFANAKEMTVNYLKSQYRLQKKLDAEQTAKNTVTAPVAEPDIT